MTVTATSAAVRPYVEAFDARPRDPAAPDWAEARRRAGIARFAELGFPTRRQESWRYTDLRSLERASFPPLGAAAPTSPGDALTAYRLGGETHRLVLIDGQVAPALSDIGELPPGAWVGSTRQALAERPELVAAALDGGEGLGAQPFVALNAAFFADGFVLSLPAGTVLERPLEIIHWGGTSSGSAHLRSAVLLGAGSRARIVESFAGTGAYWTNAVTAIDLGAGSTLHHVTLQDEAPEAIHLSALRLRLGAAARHDGFVLTLGARLSRHEVAVAVEGEAARCALNGAYLLRGEQEATVATLIDHQAPGGETREAFRGVVDERAHAAFLGKIAVRQAAQKTDAQQSSRNLLLSPRAAVDTKPELEIFADDVKCGHGATVGDLDAAALFYLRARGIGQAEARRMLIEAFAAEAIALVPDAAPQAYLRHHLERWLGNRGK